MRRDTSPHPLDPVRPRRHPVRRLVFRQPIPASACCTVAAAARAGVDADAVPVVVGPAVVGGRDHGRDHRQGLCDRCRSAGIVVGFLVTRSRNLMRIFEPMLAGLFAVPLTLFFPLFVVFFGIGPDSKVAYGAIYSFFPIALNTIAGFSSVDELYLRSVRSMGASSLQQFRYVYLPAAMPVTLTGLRIGFFICIASVLGGETLAAAAGVGSSIALAAELMETARLYAWIAFVVLVSVMLNLLALAAETRSERE